MGIVASLAAIPIAEDVVRDEKRRELQKRLEEEERLRRLKLGEYRQGDVDLELIKRYVCNFTHVNRYVLCTEYLYFILDYPFKLVLMKNI